MIPKTIHYCWFGGKPLPKLAQRCMDSWRKYCHDYEIVRWDETNFDVNCCDYVREAYEAKKWAFVSDYARLKALVDNGGVYMDTDMEVVKPIDEFLSNTAFAGLESDKDISCGIMGCVKGYAPFVEILASYHARHFYGRGGGGIRFNYNCCDGDELLFATRLRGARQTTDHRGLHYLSQVLFLS